MKNYAIILASGSGIRSGLDIPKQFVKIAGKTVLEHTLTIFQENKKIDEIIVVTCTDCIDLVKELSEKNNFSKISKIITGGETRQQSSLFGLNSIEEEDAKVLIHDAVRPFLSSKIIDDCILALDKYKAVDVAIKSADTIIKINDKNLIDYIPQRASLRRGQTPQAFDLKIIKKAHELATKCTNIAVTDDCSLVLKFNLADVYVVEGDDYNIKITYPIDIAIADKLFQFRTFSGTKRDFAKLKDKVMVVYGGLSGIGKSVCEIAKQYGAKVYPYSRTNGVDIANETAVRNSLQNVFEENGVIDYVINTSGQLVYGNLLERESKSITDEISTNYIGCINIAKAAFNYLKNSRGMLLFYSSSSYTRGRKNYAVYSSTKAAVVNLTQALSEEWDEYNIKVNVIVPERTATPMRFKNFGEEPQELLLSPDEVAKISLNTLLSNITGQIININKSLTPIEYNYLNN